MIGVFLVKKWIFWAAMCGVSVLNGLLFFAGSYSDMRRGIEGADNQAGLIFIPVLWILAAVVLLVINVCTLVRGRGLNKDLRIRFLNVFHLAGLPKGTAVARVFFFAFTLLLMALGYYMFANRFCSVLYALTGGAFLLSLYAWRHAPELQDAA